MKILFYFLTAVIIAMQSCTSPRSNEGPTGERYFATIDTSVVQTGGIKMVSLATPQGEFKVWTKRTGNNPRIKVLILHGGPGGTHEVYECFDSFFPKEGIEYYFYDQLGSYYSNQPKDSSLWTVERFVEEVEQVRKALRLDSTNFYLYGQSWGGLLAMEYALKYQSNLKALIISNMMASAPEYGKYAEEILSKQMEPNVLKEIRAIEARKDFSNPRYNELLIPNFYAQHVCRLKEWPEAVDRTFKHLNPDVYVLMQGPSEFGVAGRLKNWDRKADLHTIKVPTLTIGAKHDTMDPEHMKWMAKEVQQGRFLFCPNGSHLSQFDDQKTYLEGLIKFIKDVDQGAFKKDS